MGPLMPSTGRHRFILVVVDYATRSPEAMPLRNAMAPAIAQELVTPFTRVGFPKQIVTDQGTVFVGKTHKALAQLIGIQALHTSVYHHQTNRLVERFNGTLKRTIRKFITNGTQDWHKLHWASPHLNCYMGGIPEEFWMWLKKNGNQERRLCPSTPMPMLQPSEPSLNK